MDMSHEKRWSIGRALMITGSLAFFIFPGFNFIASRFIVWLFHKPRMSTPRSLPDVLIIIFSFDRLRPVRMERQDLER